jgi:hypothetical protein
MPVAHTKENVLGLHIAVGDPGVVQAPERLSELKG